MDELFKGIDPKETEKESNLPDELKGKSAEEIYKMLQEEHNKELGTVETEKAKLEAEKAALERVGKSEVTKPTQVYHPTQEQEQDLWTDPNAFLTKQLEQRIAPIVADFSQSMRQANRDNFAAKIGTDEWGKFGGEIEQFVNGLAPIVQKSPEAYATAYTFVRGMHADEIVEDKVSKAVEKAIQETLKNLGLEEKISEVIVEEKQPKSLFQRNTGVPVVSANKRSVKFDSLKPSPGLTLEERKAAIGFGMTEAEYARAKKEEGSV
jgi:predicted transcriptional regulator